MASEGLRVVPKGSSMRPWERAIEKQTYISYRGEWELEGVPMNVVGYRR
jgi:hypothetical protein